MGDDARSVVNVSYSRPGRRCSPDHIPAEKLAVVERSVRVVVVLVVPQNRNSLLTPPCDLVCAPQICHAIQHPVFGEEGQYIKHSTEVLHVFDAVQFSLLQCRNLQRALGQVVKASLC